MHLLLRAEGKFEKMLNISIKSDRWKSIIRTAGGVAALRIVTMVCSFLQIPLAIGALGAERFGLWTTISASVALLNFSDLGIGNGLQAKLGIYFGKNETLRCADVIYSSILLLTLIAAIVAIISITLVHNLPCPESILGLTSHLMREEARSGILAALICFALTMPISALGNTCFSLQKGYYLTAAQTFAAVFSLIWFYVLVKKSPHVSDFIYVQTIPGLVSSALIAFYVLFKLNLKISKKSLLQFSEAKSTVSLGAVYIIPQICAMIVTSIQPIFITRYIGLGEAGLYNVLSRLFSAFTLPHGIMLSSLSPAYSNAFGAGDQSWVRTNYYRSLAATLIIGIIAIVVCIVSVNVGIIELLGKGDLPKPSNLLLILLGLWILLAMIGSTIACLLNSIGKPHIQVLYGILFVILAVILMRFTMPTFGIVAIPGSLALSYLIAVIPFVYRETNKYI